MKIRSCSIFISLLIALCSCSSTKLMDSWKSPNFYTVSSSKILIFGEHQEMEVRKLYETSIANKLRSQSVDAIESHIRFPYLKQVKTAKEKARAIQLLKDAGISGVILVSLKQTIETQNGEMAAKKSVPESYASKASFTAPESKKTFPIIVTSKTYVLEALTYNLTLDKEKQLIYVCLVGVTDPASIDKIEKPFTNIVAEQFK